MIELRPLVADDWTAVHEWAQLPEACRYQAWGPNSPAQTQAFTREAAAAWQQEPQVRFAYAVVVDEQLVGNAELNLRGDRQGEISYLIHPRHWGRGIATETARELLTLGFEERGLHRIFATCDPRNVASGRVLQKIGMRHEGRMRETMLIRDGWRDSDLYAILDREWPGD
jgi:[ribosomal protein S5]-alanine N-acetyltransferase